MADTSILTRYRRQFLCRVASENMTHIAFGDGGVNAAGDPLVPSDTQTELNNEVARYPIEEGGLVFINDGMTARYSVTIPRGDLAGVKISEAGLFDAEGNLHAIKTMYVKQKDGGTSFTFEFEDEL